MKAKQSNNFLFLIYWIMLTISAASIVVGFMSTEIEYIQPRETSLFLFGGTFGLVLFVLLLIGHFAKKDFYIVDRKISSIRLGNNLKVVSKAHLENNLQKNQYIYLGDGAYSKVELDGDSFDFYLDESGEKSLENIIKNYKKQVGGNKVILVKIKETVSEKDLEKLRQNPFKTTLGLNIFIPVILDKNTKTLYFATKTFNRWFGLLTYSAYKIKTKIVNDLFGVDRLTHDEDFLKKRSSGFVLSATVSASFILAIYVILWLVPDSYNYNMWLSLFSTGFIVMFVMAIFGLFASLIFYFRLREKQISTIEHFMDIEDLKDVFEVEYQLREKNRFRKCKSCGGNIPKDKTQCLNCGKN